MPDTEITQTLECLNIENLNDYDQALIVLCGMNECYTMDTIMQF